MTMRGHQSFGSGADHAAGLLVSQGPFQEALGNGFEAGVVEKVRERDEAVEVIGATFPGFAGAAEPAGVGADVGPGFAEVAAEAVGLDLKLGAKPARGADGAERKRSEYAGKERSAGADWRLRRGCGRIGEGDTGQCESCGGEGGLLEEVAARG